MTKETTIPTPYDNAYRTILTHCRRLVIPLVNEMFGENYSPDARVKLMQNERFVGGENKIVTDSHLLIESKRYHIECQSTNDGTMLIRVFEYDAQIALDDQDFDGGELTVRFPESGILFLRHRPSTPDMMVIRIVVPNGSIRYEVPVLKAQEYSLDELFEKKLFFLLPFHLFVFEREMSVIENSQERREEFRTYYTGLRIRLEEASEKGEISAHDKRTVLEMAVKVSESLAKNHKKVREEVDCIMGGMILDHEAEIIMNEGREEERRLNGRLFIAAKEAGRLDAYETALTDNEKYDALVKELLG